MFVPSMTYQEIAKEFFRDFEDEIHAKAMTCFGRRPRMTSHIMKHLGANEKCIFEPMIVTSKRNNKWICFFWTNGKKQFRQNGILKSCYMMFDRSDGVHLVHCDPMDPSQVTFYTPHFFDRYRERHLKDTSVSYFDAIQDYAVNCVGSFAVPIESEKYQNSLFAVTGTGVSLVANIDGDIWECRTYISFDMLKGDQINRYQDLVPSIRKAEEKLADIEKHRAGVAVTKPIIKDSSLEFKIKYCVVIDGRHQPFRKVRITISPLIYNTFIQYYINRSGNLANLPNELPGFISEIGSQIDEDQDALLFYDFNAMIKFAREREQVTGSAFID